jgi:hypothetical protein
MALSSGSRSASPPPGLQQAPPRVRDHHPPGADTRRRAAPARLRCARRGAPARRRWRAPGVGATGRRSGDRGRRSDDVPLARRRRKSPLFRGFSAHRAGAPTPDTAGPSGAGGRVIGARAMGEAARAALWAGQKPEKRRGCRGIKTSDNARLSDVFSLYIRQYRSSRAEWVVSRQNRASGCRNGPS